MSVYDFWLRHEFHNSKLYCYYEEKEKDVLYTLGKDDFDVGATSIIDDQETHEQAKCGLFWIASFTYYKPSFSLPCPMIFPVWVSCTIQLIEVIRTVQSSSLVNWLIESNLWDKLKVKRQLFKMNGEWNVNRSDVVNTDKCPIYGLDMSTR